MVKHILIIGPSGSGKTYISASLRKQGVSAPDADLIEGLSGWFGAGGKQVTYPENADKEFLDNHEFLWNRDFLSKFLNDQKDDLYLFGMSGNIFDMVDLFDKVYFLKTSPEILAQRLRHESRKNPMGRTDYQLQNALSWSKEIEERANKVGIEMIDANQTPEQIFSQVGGDDVIRRVIFFDCYQTLIDIELFDEETKKTREQQGWGKFINLLNQSTHKKISVSDFLSLLANYRNDFYKEKDKKMTLRAAELRGIIQLRAK